MYTQSEAIEAIRAVINGEWDNPLLPKLTTSLTASRLDDIRSIIDNTSTN